MAQTSSNAPDPSSTNETKLLRTLQKSDYKSDRDRIPLWTSDSCDWFLQEPLYQSWKDEPKSSFLWLSGRQGCGKSVLASFLIAELGSEESQIKLPGTVCYFFFDTNYKENMNPCTALCAVLHQLFTSKTGLIEYALSDFDAQGQAFTEQVTTLWRILGLVIADPRCGKNIICIIDGLSECEEDVRVPFINSIARLYSECENPQIKRSPLKIIATTNVPLEPSSTETRRLEQTTMKSITLSPEKAKSLYIKDRVGKIVPIKGFSNDLQAKLITDLTGALDWTFLFLSLFLDLLENVAVSDDEAARYLDLSKKANNPADAYKISLSRCPDRSRATTSTLLGIVCAAAEPLTLKEINVAMGIKGGAEINEQYPITPEIIKSLCGILLQLVDSKVIFVHRTAREFLVNSDQAGVNLEQWKPTLNLNDSHKLFAEICVSFLSKLDFGNDPLGIPPDGDYQLIEQKIKKYTAKYPFLEYAARHWAEHFAFLTAEQSEQLVNSVIKLCETSSDAFRVWFRIYWTYAYAPFSPPKRMTSVMVDCHFGHCYVLGQRRQRGFIDIKPADERGYTALHWAAQSGKSEIVESILQLEPDLNAKTQENRTALDLAAGRGHEKVVQLIFSRIDDRADTNSPMAANPKRKGISNSTNLSVFPKETSQNRKKYFTPMEKDRMRILMLIEAAQDGNEDRVEHLLDQDTNSNQTNHDGLTALHVAASKNHPSVVHLLLEKGRADIDRRNKDGETALALASAKGHKAVVEVLLRRGANTGGVDLDGSTLFSRADASVKKLLERPPIVKGPSVVPRARSPPPLIPYVRKGKEKSHPTHSFHATVLDLWVDFDEERSQFANPTVHDLLYGNGPNSIMSPLQGDMRRAPTFRWLHLPSNNLIWIKHLVKRIYDERIGCEPGKMKASHFVAKSKNVDRLFDAGQQFRAPKDAAIHIDKSSTAHNCSPLDSKPLKGRRADWNLPKDESAKDENASKDNDIVLFMPFLHYETNAGRKSIAQAIDSATKNRKVLNEEEKGTPDEELIHTYLHERPYMHIRRTLDQYYYHTMKDTTERDEDQVVYRYARKMWPEEDESVYILMVDQLWLWILDGDTVITSFPQRWNREQSNNDLDVVESIRKHINLPEGRDPLRSAYDLAVLIASFCSEVLFEREDDPEPLDERLQFLDFFDKSIGDVTANETACFNRLASFFKDLDNKTRENEGFFIEAMKKEVDDDRLQGPTALNTDKPYDVFYHIGEEAALLREIKDIRDELNIITKVFIDQQKALEAMHKLVGSKVKFKAKSPSSEIIRRIKRHMSDIKEIDDHASRTYEALNHLLDLKQKHANVCEARWTREQAQETAKQSNTIMVFTIVTIIFLPLSFMAAFFALQIVQFPKDEEGALAMELDYVARYLFGISAAIIVPFIVIAFNVNRLGRIFREWFGQLVATRFGTWLSLRIFEVLGLPKEKGEILVRRREHRTRKQEEQRKAKYPPPDLSVTEKMANGSFKKENIQKTGVHDQNNGPVHSRSFPPSFRSRHSFPNIDEENQGGLMWPRIKARTFPFLQRSHENGFREGPH
ncbi:hypothetical protein MMC07_003489 [Pseudocyphellaria aurata]|nr:hypothetical protein [Pseudocyphellaria aurata]